MAKIVDVNKTQLSSPNCKIQKQGKNSCALRVVATTNIEPKTVIWFEIASVYSGTSMMDEPEWISILPEWCQKQIECSIIHKTIPFINQTDWMLVYHIIVKMQSDKSFNFEHLFPNNSKNDEIYDMCSTDWVICRLLAKTFMIDVLQVANIHRKVQSHNFPLFPKNCPRFVIGHAIFPFTSFFQRSHTSTKTHSNAQMCIELGYDSEFPSITVISQKLIKKGQEIVISCDLFDNLHKTLSPAQKFGEIPKGFCQLLFSTNLSIEQDRTALRSMVTVFNEQCFKYGSQLNKNFSETEMIKLCSLIETGLNLSTMVRSCLFLWRTKSLLKNAKKMETSQALAELCCQMDKLYSTDMVKHDMLESYIITHCVVCHNMLISDQKDQKTLFCYSILCSPAFIASWALKQYSALMAYHSTIYQIKTH